jgi:hypothetical protein
MLDGHRMSSALFSIVTFLVLVLSIIFYSDYTAAAKTGEVDIRGSKALLTEGEAMKVTLTAQEPSTMNEVSFSAKIVAVSDPFASSQIPFTIEVYETDQLVASESFTWSLGDKFEKVSSFINNTPRMDERYKMLIRYDVPEDNGPGIPIQIDAESIKINGGNGGIDVQGRIKVVFPNF